MIVTSTATSAALRYTPPWLEHAEPKPVFLLRAGSVIERQMLEAELAGEYRAGEVWSWDLHDAACAGLRALGGEEAERLVSLAEAERAGAIESEEDSILLSQAKALLAEHWPDYRRLVAQMDRRAQLFPVLAFRRFCVGWENVLDATWEAPVDEARSSDTEAPESAPFVPFARGADGLVSEEALARISPVELLAAGRRAYDLQYLRRLRKNSDAPSKSADAPETSTAGAASKAGGLSAGNDGA